MTVILKVRPERYSPYCHQVFSKLIPDKTIHMHLVEISPTMRATQKANIRNGDRTNVQVNQHYTIKELLTSSSEYTMLVAHKFLDALPIRVLQVIQLFPIFQMRFVLIYLENRQSLARGFASGSHKYRRKIAAPKLIQMKPQPPLFPFDVFRSYAPPIQLMHLAALPSNSRI